MEQKCAGPVTSPVMEQFEKCSGRALAIPLNQTVKMKSTSFTPKFPFGNHE
jgi:hypothetical protein